LLKRLKYFTILSFSKCASINEIINSEREGESTLIKNYFKVAIRHILKNKGFSFINIIGLAKGGVL